MKTKLTVVLDGETEEKLRKYLLKVTNEQGMYPHGTKTKIVKEAINEWLDAHLSD